MQQNRMGGQPSRNKRPIVKAAAASIFFSQPKLTPNPWLPVLNLGLDRIWWVLVRGLDLDDLRSHGNCIWGGDGVDRVNVIQGDVEQCLRRGARQRIRGADSLIKGDEDGKGKREKRRSGRISSNAVIQYTLKMGQTQSNISRAQERVSEQANEWAVQANKRADERVAHY